MRRRTREKPARRRPRGTVTGLAAVGCIVLAGAAVTGFSSQEANGFSEMRSRLAHHAGSVHAQRAGLKSNDESLRVAALGDSVPAGLGTSSTFVDLVGKALADQEDRNLAVDNQAVSGIDSNTVVSQLSDASSAPSQAVAQADLTIIEVGANDFDESSASQTSCAPVETSGCYADEMTTMKKNVQTIVDAVKKRRAPGARIVLVGYWNTFKDGQAGQSISADYVSQGRALARWINTTTKSIADSEDVLYADTYTPFFANGKDATSELQDDGDHPNDAGNRVIADAVLEALGSSARAS